MGFLSGFTSFLISLVLVITSTFWGGGSDLKELSQQCDINFNQGTVISEEDNHGGFHGDGESLTVVEYEDDQLVSDIKANTKWHELPYASGIDSLTGENYCTLDMPAVSEGYYYFRDRSPDTQDPYSVENILASQVMNYTVAVYDTENNRLFLYKSDI